MRSHSVGSTVSVGRSDDSNVESVSSIVFETALQRIVCDESKTVPCQESS